MIVVGVDGSEGSAAALRWALAEASLRETNVLALYAWTMPAPAGRMGAYAEPLQDPGAFHEGAAAMLDGFLEEAGAGSAGVEIEKRAVQGSAADALIQAAGPDDLIVVGSRGHGGFASLLLGSVSQQTAMHARCPVVIVRG